MVASIPTSITCRATAATASTCTHLAGRLIAELLRGDAERFDAFANLPHYPFPVAHAARTVYRDWARRITACAIVGVQFPINSEESKGVKHEQQ
ncbi:hypothetical protein ACVXG9_05265 [Escherichia coli]